MSRNDQTDSSVVAGSELTGVQLQQRLQQLEQENSKLKRINRALVDRVESGPGNSTGAWGAFEHSVFLAEQVRERTEALNAALAEVRESNQALKAASHQARTAYGHLQDAIESIADAFVLYDSGGRLLLWNSKFGNLWKGSELTIQPGLLQQQISRAFHQCGLIRRYYRGADDGGQAVGEDITDHRRLFQLTSGQWIQLSEHRTGDGGLVELYKDISALIESEQALREKALEASEHRIRLITDAVPVLIAYVNRQGVFEFANRAYEQWYGRSRHDVPGRRLEEVLTRRQLGQLRPWIDRALAGEVVDFEIADPAADGTERFVAKSYIPHLDDNDQPLGFYVLVQDITERRRTAEELRSAYQHLELRVEERTSELRALNTQLLQAKREAERANHSKTRFLAAASHDLLQPMNAARLFAASLAEQPLSDKTAELVRALGFSLENMESLLAALVDISKLEAGVVAPDRISFRASDLLGNLANEYRTLATDQGIGFRYIPCSAVIHTDSQLLARILRNFLSNAIRYTEYGRILLGCRRTSSGLLIQVWDTGIGIAADKLEDIFEEFNRLDHERGQSDKGLGLGLAIVDKMSGVLKHPVSVHSEPGGGSCFSVEVPFGLASAVGDGADSTQVIAADEFAGRRVLVLDNDPSICQAMETLLSGWGCEVCTALSADQAIACLSDSGQLPELIVADYHLDNGDNGLDAVARILARCESTLPVLMISANYSNELKQQVRLLGYRLLNKPVRPAKLKAVAQHLLKLYREAEPRVAADGGISV